MKYEVKFQPSRRIDIMGPGAVFLDETGLVLEGDFPRFYVPFLSRVLRRIIAANGLRTVPFSKVLSYHPPRLLNRQHRLAYELPNHLRAIVRFTMRRKKASNNRDFATRLAEYQAAARTLQS